MGAFKLATDCAVSGTVHVGGYFSLTGLVKDGVLPKVRAQGSHSIFSLGKGGRLMMKAVEITGGTTECGGSGGAISGGIATFDGVTFRGNTCSYCTSGVGGRGAALYISGGDVMLTRATFSSNNRINLS